MLDMFKDRRAVPRNQVWCVECPNCFGYVEFYRVSPGHCPECGRVLLDYSDILRSREKRKIFYQGADHA